jgi:hypothetical protein
MDWPADKIERRKIDIPTGKWYVLTMYLQIRGNKSNA